MWAAFAAHAGDGPADGPSWAVAAGFEPAAYTSRERLADGRVANTERGSLDGYWLSLEVPGAVRWLSTRHTGTVDYVGFSQVGLPIVTTTRLAVLDQRLSWRPRWHLGPALTIAAELAVGQRNVERDILPTPFTSRLSEQLRWDYVRGGWSVELPLDPVTRIDLGAGLEHGLRGRLTPNFHGFGSSPALEPARRGGAWVEAGLMLRLSAAVHARVNCQAHRQRYGPSPPQPFSAAQGATGSVSYPGSTQTLRGCGASLGYAFGAGW